MSINKKQPQRASGTVEPLVRHTFETFRDIGPYELGNLQQKKPSCFNGVVCVRKYRVTVELVDEPVEVLRERVQALWDSCNNHHHWEPLQWIANTLGMERLEKSNITGLLRQADKEKTT